MESIKGKKDSTHEPEVAYDTLAELIAGIAVWGVLGQILLAFILKGNEAMIWCSICWWLGVGVAVFWAVHLSGSLKKALSSGEGKAMDMLRYHAVVRYLVAAAVMFIIYVADYLGLISRGLLEYGISYVPGILTLKLGAYSQPFMHKIFSKVFHPG